MMTTQGWSYFVNRGFRIRKLLMILQIVLVDQIIF